jgi:hypothetical protein
MPKRMCHKAYKAVSKIKIPRQHDHSPFKDKEQLTGKAIEGGY